ncbi:MAG: hypothetical protein ACE5JG_07920 [Planctomycetota bacterium]
MSAKGLHAARSEPYPAQRAALRVDAAAVRVARGRGAIDVAIRETLVRLFRGDRLLQLGYARQVDYARERLGMPARTMFLWVRLARGLSQRPLLRRAVVAGAVSPHKALAILPLAVREDEGPWTAAAMTGTLAELEEAVRSAGREPPEVFEAESLWLRMTPAQQDRLDAAIALAQQAMGFGAPRWQCVEAICQEWLGTFGAWLPEEEAEPPEPSHRKETRMRAKAVARQLHAIEEAVSVSEETEEAASEDALSLDARLRRLLRARRSFDAAFGPLALRIVRARTWAVLGYRSLAEYCRERLGMSARAVRERVWLERRMSALPPLREALASGRLTYSKALLVAKDARISEEAERIREAASTTWQQTERQSTAAGGAAESCRRGPTVVGTQRRRGDGGGRRRRRPGVVGGARRGDRRRGGAGGDRGPFRGGLVGAPETPIDPAAPQRSADAPRGPVRGARVLAARAARAPRDVPIARRIGRRGEPGGRLRGAPPARDPPGLSDRRGTHRGAARLEARDFPSGAARSVGVRGRRRRQAGGRGSRDLGHPGCLGAGGRPASARPSGRYEKGRPRGAGGPKEASVRPGQFSS